MFDLAARSASRTVRAIDSARVTMSRKLSSPAVRRVARRNSSSSASTRSALRIETWRRSAPTGLTTKSVAPARMAEMTASIEPCAVCTIAGTEMSRCRIRASTPMPSRSGITRSRMARLIGGRSLASRRANAPSPDSAVSTSYPNRLAIASSRRRWMGSSSTTSIRAVIVVPKPALGTAHCATLCHHGKRSVNAASFRPAVSPKAPLCRRVAIAETLARA